MRPSDCEYCAELASPYDNAFTALYGRSRTASPEAGFVTMPTLGALFLDSVLVVPEEHIERFADLTGARVAQARQMIDAAKHRIADERSIVVFEHGARRATGGACGIYHAHVHVVPVPTDVHYESLIDDSTPAADLTEAWQQVSPDEDYILVEDSMSRVALRRIAPEERARFPSQHIRRQLADLFALTAPWNWREYPQPEPLVARCLERLSTQEHLIDAQP